MKAILIYVRYMINAEFHWGILREVYRKTERNNEYRSSLKVKRRKLDYCKEKTSHQIAVEVRERTTYNSK
jgi:hypothetical protein